ncbi:MAG: c-type cytochrome [Gallionella sp.]
MKILTLAIALLCTAPLASAIDMPDLAKKNRCNDCHAIDKKIIGPAWMDVSKKYRNQPEIEATLIAKVSKGGVGVWGDMPMPANDPGGRKQDDIKALVQFVLGLAK